MSDFDDDEEFGLGEVSIKNEDPKPAGAVSIRLTVIKH